MEFLELWPIRILLALAVLALGAFLLESKRKEEAKALKQERLKEAVEEKGVGKRLKELHLSEEELTWIKHNARKGLYVFVFPGGLTLVHKDKERQSSDVIVVSFGAKECLKSAEVDDYFFQLADEKSGKES